MPRYIHELPDGSYRDAEQSEIDAAKAIRRRAARLRTTIRKAQEELGLINSSCEHVVCHDEGGHPYNIRICLACGETSLL